MKHDTWPPRCYLCGKFISYADMEVDRTLTWTPYGGPLSLEPPPDEWAHLTCWEAIGEDQRWTIKRLAWQGPALHRLEASS